VAPLDTLIALCAFFFMLSNNPAKSTLLMNHLTFERLALKAIRLFLFLNKFQHHAEVLTITSV
jgi:hypothetical protein